MSKPKVVNDPIYGKLYAVTVNGVEVHVKNLEGTKEGRPSYVGHGSKEHAMSTLQLRPATQHDSLNLYGWTLKTPSFDNPMLDGKSKAVLVQKLHTLFATIHEPQSEDPTKPGYYIPLYEIKSQNPIAYIL